MGVSVWYVFMVFVMVETGSLWYSVGMLKHVVQLYCMLRYSHVVLLFIWE